MIRFLSIIFTCAISLSTLAQDALNIRKIKSIDRGSTSYSGSWVYVNDAGEEYGLVGSASGTAIYSLEEGMDEELAFILGPTSNWREFTVIGDHAFVTTEGTGDDDGLQVLELSQLPDTAYLLTTFDSTFTRGHILQKDIFNPDDPYIYVSGTDSTGALHILDVSDPMHPLQVGLHDTGAYIHDVHVRGNRMYTFQFHAAIIEIVDISDKTNPILLSSFADPGGATHSGWTTMDNNYLLVADERNGFDGRIFDIRDINDVTEVSTFTSNEETFVHNPYVRGDFAYLAHNEKGLRIYDLVDPTNPVEVGYYNTVTEENPQSRGLWSACPFIPSGKVIGGDRDLGLVVWETEEVYASRFRGVVKDAATLETIDSVSITVEGKPTLLFTDGFGEYKSGFPGEEIIQLTFEKEGYLTEQRTVALSLQDQQIVDVLMTSGTVSILQAEPTVSIKIWPNPAQDLVHIDLNEFSDVQSVQIVDIAGRVVMEQQITDKRKASISTPHLQSGIYTLQIIDGKNKILAIKKLAILRK